MAEICKNCGVLGGGVDAAGNERFPFRLHRIL